MSSNEQAKASKEKTREIKVWVDVGALEQFLKHPHGYSVTIRNTPFGQFDCEVTLLIKEPEKTVTISESQFAQMAREIEYDSRLTTISSNHISARTKWFNRLFGSET